MVPARLVLARMPVELSAPVIPMVPAFETLLLLLMVTAAPLVGFTEPVEVMLTSCPEVVTGVVTAVLIVCAAVAGVASIAARAPMPVVVNRKRMSHFPLFARGKEPRR